MTSFDISTVMTRSGMRMGSVPAPLPTTRSSSALLLIADRALEVCGAFEPSSNDTPELAAAKAFKRAAMLKAGDRT